MCFGDWCHVQLVSDAEMAAAIGANAAGERKKGKAKEESMYISAITSGRIGNCEMPVSCRCMFPVPLVE
jgi:hypothetical protein